MIEFRAVWWPENGEEARASASNCVQMVGPSATVLWPNVEGMEVSRMEVPDRSIGERGGCKLKP